MASASGITANDTSGHSPQAAPEVYQRPHDELALARATSKWRIERLGQELTKRQQLVYDAEGSWWIHNQPLIGASDAALTFLHRAADVTRHDVESYYRLILSQPWFRTAFPRKVQTHKLAIRLRESYNTAGLITAP